MSLAWRLSLVVVLLAQGLAAPPAAQAVDPAPAPAPVPARIPDDVRVQAPAGPVLLGDAVTLEVWGPGVADLRVDAEGALGDVLVGRTALSRKDDGTHVSRVLRFAREGEQRLALTLVRADGREQPLPPWDVDVRLDLPAGHVPRVADLLPPLPVPRPPAPRWPFLSVCLGGLVALGWFVVAAGRDRPVVQYVPPADQVAIAALARLRLELPRTREEIRPFVIRVSDVLRTYVEGVFALHAPAQTTEEFLEAAARRHDALGERRVALGDFLQRCDLVKYAGERPAPAAAEPLLDTVEGFVEETRDCVGTARGSVGAVAGTAGPGSPTRQDASAAGRRGA